MQYSLHNYSGKTKVMLAMLLTIAAMKRTLYGNSIYTPKHCTVVFTLQCNGEFLLPALAFNQHVFYYFICGRTRLIVKQFAYILETCQKNQKKHPSHLADKISRRAISGEQEDKQLDRKCIKTCTKFLGLWAQNATSRDSVWERETFSQRGVSPEISITLQRCDT